MTTVTMPQLGESVTEGTIVAWLKSEGDTVALDEPLCEIETEKVTAELPSPVAGVLRRILVPQGETVAVGAALCEVEEAGGTAAGLAPGAARGEVELRPVGRAALATPGTPASGAEAPGGGRRRFYSPAVQRLAELHGVDLSLVPGTGIGGRVTRKDVEAYVARAGAGVTGPRSAEPEAPPVGVAASAGADVSVVPLVGVRKTIAENMARSNREVPQAWTMVEVDMTRLAARRAALEGQLSGRKVTFLPLFIEAVCRALREHPRLNARLEDGEVRVWRRLNIGVAVATDWGLVVPVLHDAGELSAEGLAVRLEELVRRARERQLTVGDVEGGTFTVNNTGAFGSIASKPLVLPPQVAIVTLERVVRRPVVVGEDALAIRQLANVCLSFDHRALDGLEAGRFLATLRGYLEGGGGGPE
ncbi:dihydrolipoamide acetyltransferase family protein [Tepidiforma sp.]|uniref:dihydrolipoamide acetyltransferase family protein n=1 Tax=Tepidiforma sp. TaxID=2682230 RepID=UPI002ADD67EE|nr:dihydrolipoamide acetyltransferase family protein [Tepidiforma sp.]